MLGVTGSASVAKGNENQSSSTNTESVINASGTLTMKSGNDTNIIGSQATGEKVVADVGGNLNIISQQDSETYTSKNQSAGISFGTGKIGGTHGSASASTTNSDYTSVVEQAGIFAGKGGAEIRVEDTTTLIGGVISSTATPDKVKISTDKLNWMDQHNKAKYSSSGFGINYNAGKDRNGNPIATKDSGLTPSIPVSASGDASSTTQSAISPGTIEVRSNPNQDLSGLSRDPAGAVNALGKIFDKKTVQERQELAKVFGEEAFKAVGNLGLKPGSPEKATIDAVMGGIMAQLGGSSFLSGAAGAGFNQILQSELSKIQDPAMRQWASAIIGAAAAGVAGGDIQAGASVAVSEIRNNDFEDVVYLAKLIKENPQLATTLLISGLYVKIVEGQQQLIDKGGKVIAYCNPGGNWLDSAGSLIGDLKTWISNKFNPPATNTTPNGQTILDNPANDPSIGGTTIDGEHQGQVILDNTYNPVNTGNVIAATVNDILDSAIETTSGTGVARNFDKSGGYEQTLKDFESLNLSNVKDIQTQYGPGKVGTLSDGTKVVARPGSKTDGPTLEIQISNTKVYKVRY